MRRAAAITALLLAAPSAAATPTEIALAFYDLAVNQGQPKAAFDRYVAPGYVEHSGDVAGGTRAATLAFMEALAVKAPKDACTVVRTIAQGDLVVLHARCRAEAAGPVLAIAEIFRVENGKLIEHWDVIAPVRDPAINPNPPF